MADRSSVCFFCEDIRQEAGGKLSLMGALLGAIKLTSAPPVELPKLYALAHLDAETDDPIKALRLVVLLGETQVFDRDVPREMLAQALEENSHEGRYVVTLVVPLTEMKVTHACDLVLELLADGVTVGKHSVHIITPKPSAAGATTP